jgi:hypothetical protein
MPLEGLWWAEEMSNFTAADTSNWKWTMMIAQFSFVTRGIVGCAVADVKKKKNATAIAGMRLESLSEEKCVQRMHIGPFSLAERKGRVLDAFCVQE